MADNLPSPTEFRAGRSDSTASSSSTGSTTGSWANVKQQAAAATATGTTPTTQQPPRAQQHFPYRRPSHPLFEGLTAQKRKDDAESVARRQSLSEQRPATGFLGQMWNNWVYGK
ncbi:hypothetical protein B0I37DRAFT_416895 [Chaetomium sp. MPI-CAGE-AT-0009]|nr:hypothetical protein B0I37DRAFT_416895 [Chaetomium sp. MPI-CAGE-AT-0009]